MPELRSRARARPDEAVGQTGGAQGSHSQSQSHSQSHTHTEGHRVLRLNVHHLDAADNVQSLELCFHESWHVASPASTVALHFHSGNVVTRGRSYYHRRASASSSQEPSPEPPVHERARRPYYQTFDRDLVSSSSDESSGREDVEGDPAEAQEPPHQRQILGRRAARIICHVLVGLAYILVMANIMVQIRDEQQYPPHLWPRIRAATARATATASGGSTAAHRPIVREYDIAAKVIEPLRVFSFVPGYLNERIGEAFIDSLFASQSSAPSSSSLDGVNTQGEENRRLSEDETGGDKRLCDAVKALYMHKPSLLWSATDKTSDGEDDHPAERMSDLCRKATSGATKRALQGAWRVVEQEVLDHWLQGALEDLDDAIFRLRLRERECANHFLNCPSADFKEPRNESAALVLNSIFQGLGPFEVINASFGPLEVGLLGRLPIHSLPGLAASIEDMLATARNLASLAAETCCGEAHGDCEEDPGYEEAGDGPAIARWAKSLTSKFPWQQQSEQPTPRERICAALPALEPTISKLQSAGKVVRGTGLRITRAREKVTAFGALLKPLRYGVGWEAKLRTPVTELVGGRWVEYTHVHWSMPPATEVAEVLQEFRDSLNTQYHALKEEYDDRKREDQDENSSDD